MQKFYVLGTCAGISDKGFTLSGVLQHNDKCLLVDTGGGMQILKQLRLSGINVSTIHDVFISHKHILLKSVKTSLKSKNRASQKHKNKLLYRVNYIIACHSPINKRHLTIHYQV